MKAEANKTAKSGKVKEQKIKQNPRRFRKRITMVVAAILMVFFASSEVMYHNGAKDYAENDAANIRSQLCDDEEFNGDEGEKQLYAKLCDFQATNRNNENVWQYDAQIFYCRAMFLVSLLFFVNALEDRE